MFYLYERLLSTSSRGEQMPFTMATVVLLSASLVIRCFGHASKGREAVQ